MPQVPFYGVRVRCVVPDGFRPATATTTYETLNVKLGIPGRSRPCDSAKPNVPNLHYGDDKVGGVGLNYRPRVYQARALSSELPPE